MGDSYLVRPALSPDGWKADIALPYGLAVEQVRIAMEEVYDFIHDVNNFLVSRDYGRLEELVLGNTFSGLISEVIVKAMARNTRGLERNTLIGGHPDLVPTGRFPQNAVLRGDEGIEIKTSIQPGGWQGHNPEVGWIMVFQYSLDIWSEPVEDRRPFEFQKVMLAHLDESDWSFSGRIGTSRRTPTASIVRSGTERLHDNWLYQRPGYTRSRLRKPVLVPPTD